MPIVKKPQEEPTVSNVRPISLQTASTKLLSKLLADRLVAVLAAHPILHPAQEGFVRGGSVHKCVDMCVDVWEVAKQRGKPCYNLFYDVKAAYDSVPHAHLLRSLRRLAMPAAFVELVADSLQGLSSTVRTAYGETESFDVQRSVRQGDPTGTAAVRVLHGCTALWTGAQPAVRWSDRWVRAQRSSASGRQGLCRRHLGCVRQPDGLQRMNEWVSAFCDFNQLTMNGAKTVAGRSRGRRSVHDQHLDRVGGMLVHPTPLDQSIRYLGVHLCMQLSWSAQCAGDHTDCAAVLWPGREAPDAGAVCCAAVQSVSLPKIDAGLRYLNLSGWRAQCEQWDKSLVRAIGHLCKMPRRLNRGAVATLDRTHACRRRMLCRCKSVRRSCDATLSEPVHAADWVSSGRIRWLQSWPAAEPVGSAPPIDWYKCKRWRETASAGAWVWCSDETSGRGRGRQVKAGGCQRSTHRLATVSTSQSCWEDRHILWCSAARRVQDGVSDCGSNRSVTMCTDGSAALGSTSGAAAEPPSSSWAVCCVEDELQQCHTQLPAEADMRVSHLHGLAVWGAGIPTSVSQGIYMAELQAVLRAISAVPVSWAVEVVMDSKSALQAIQSYSTATTPRQRLRVEGRPLLALINKQMAAKEKHGGSVRLVHIRSHTTDSTVQAVGNRCADVVASAERQAMLLGRDPDSYMPALDLRQGEQWMCIQQTDGDRGHGERGQVVSGDVRRAARKCLSQQALQLWRNSRTQAAFVECSQALAEMYKWLCQDAPNELRPSVPFFLRLATNTVHVWWDAGDERRSM